MRLLLLFFPLSLLAQQATSDSLTGTWVNANLESDGITQVVIHRDEHRMMVHVWGACHPLDCDWGETEAELWKGTPLAIWKAGFSTTTVQLVEQPDGRLLVVYRSEYHDGSGRKDPGHAEFFTRQNAQQDSPETAEARALLQQVAEKYRNLPASRLESTETIDRIGMHSETRKVTHSTILLSPPNKLRMENSGSGEPSVIIEDGRFQWRVYPKTNEYTKLPQPKQYLSNSPLFTYSLLDKSRGDPRIIGRHEQLEGSDCTVVSIVDLQRRVKQELWIDNATHVIRKETFENPSSSSDASIKSETVYTVIRLGEPGKPEMFAYDPAATQAKNRTELAADAPESMQGTPAPDFSLPDLSGRVVRLSSLRGKVVLLDFWGTWCGYCREALPTIELLHRSLKDKGLLVFGVDSEAPEVATEYLQKFGFTLPSLVDSKDEAVAHYHVQSWPTTVLIDRKGKIVLYDTEENSQKLRDALLTLKIW